jgi:hypothetical protein
VLLYTHDEGVLPPLRNDAAHPHATSRGSIDRGTSPDAALAELAEDELRRQRAEEREAQPLTKLEEGPHGSGYKRLRAWRGAPLLGKFAGAWPPVHEQPRTKAMGSPFGDLPQLSMFALPHGAELRALPPKASKGPGRSMMPPLPTRRTTLEQHSFVWTNYWDNESMPDAPAAANAPPPPGEGSGACGAAPPPSPSLPEASPSLLAACGGDGRRASALHALGAEAEGCPGEDRARLYFHAATVWAPLAPGRNEQVSLTGARLRSHQRPGCHFTPWLFFPTHLFARCGSSSARASWRPRTRAAGPRSSSPRPCLRPTSWSS